MTRTEARELAFFIVFEYSFSGEGVDEIIENSAVARNITVPPFSRKLAEGVISNVAVLDQTITDHSKGWSISRISKVSLAILRVALYEMLYNRNEVPMSVSINEAVNLCKTYAGDDDYAFVNGILGTVARENGDTSAKPDGEN